MNDVLTRGRTAVAEALAGTWSRRIAALIAFAVLTGVGAAIELKIPGSPVPITAQTMIVSLAGVLLGPWLGAASQALYLLAGALGAPVFAGGAFGIGWLFGPTGGYLLAFPLAAAVTGWLAGPASRRGVLPALRLLSAIAIGTVVIFVGGASQLAWFTGDAQGAVRLGVLPFLAGDALKILAAFLVAVRYRAKTLGSL
ncbi:MAG: biotin transporter BioY [Gemmatimonadota bacterium]|jgi:biotin transport system substrate-specific component